MHSFVDKWHRSTHECRFCSPSGGGWQVKTCSLYLPTQSQALYHSASSNPLARRSSSGLDVRNEEANIRANVDVADGHVDVHADIVLTYRGHTEQLT